jgi:hypothetical protein
LQQSGEYVFPDSLEGSIEVLPDGSAYFSNGDSLYHFIAVPDPQSIPISNPQSVPGIWNRMIVDNATDAILLVTGPRAYLRTTSETTFNVIFPILTQLMFASPSLDSYNRVFWRTICDPYNGYIVIERYDMDPDALINPTHTSEFPDVSCSWETEAQAAAGFGAVDPVAKIVISAPTSEQVVITDLYDCSAASTCTQCSLDSMYCSWCVGTGGSSCVDASACPAPNVSINTCPLVTSMTPSSISKEGVTDIVLSGNNFAQLEAETASLGGLYCKLDTSLSKAVIYSDALLRCTVHTPSTSGNRPLYLALNTSAVVDTESALTVPVYSCDNLDICSNCASAGRRDCKWCSFDSVCMSRLAVNASCPTSGSPQVAFANSASTCNRLTGMTPTSIPTHFSGVSGIPQSVVISSTFPNTASGWTCIFDSTPVTGVLDFTNQQLSCLIPTRTVPPGSSEVSSLVQVKLFGKFYATNALTLRYYDCTVPTSCSSCSMPSRPYCSWCLSTVGCMANTSACANFLTSSGTCPAASLSPLSTRGSSATPLTITGGPFFSASSYFCNFTSTTVNGLVPASFVDSSTITCDAASAAVSTFFDVQVDVSLNARVYASAGTLRYYSCAGTTCSSCAHPLHTECAWCVEESQCDTDANMGSTCPSKVGPGQCPMVTNVNPAFGSYHGGQEIRLTGSGLGFGGSYECSFGGPNNASSGFISQFSSATIENGNTALCDTPSVPQTKLGPYTVSIRYTDAANVTSILASNATFTYQDCRALSTCGQCLTSPQCKWCLADARCKYQADTCYLDKTLTFSQSGTCPAITSVQPLAAQAGSNTTIVVRGTNLNDPQLSPFLRCDVDGINMLVARNRTAFGADEDVYNCHTHPLAIAGLNQFSFYIVARSRGQYAQYRDENGQPYYFDTYDCSASKTCDECAQNPSNMCGWCSSDNKCTDSASCSALSTWAQQSCPRVTKLYRTLVDENAVGRPFELTVENLNLAGSTSLVCSFATPLANVTRAVTAKSLGDGKVTCPLGTSPNPNTFGVLASVSILHANDLSKRFTTNVGDAFYDPSANLEYVKCQRPVIPISTCGECIRVRGTDVDSRCGWCVYDGYCGITSSCNPGHPLPEYQNVTSDCASVTKIDPTEGPSTGSTQITITGAGFIQSSQLRCKFGDLLSPTVFESSTRVTCVTPERSDLKSGSASADFQLVLMKNTGSGNRRDAQVDANDYIVFATTSQPVSFTFNYVAPAKKQNLAWIAAPIVVVVLLVIVAIIVLVFLRKRYRERKLTPPDYIKYAFSANTKLIREVSDDKKPALDSLVPLLSENNYALGLAIADVTSGGEDDLLSRALVYSAYPNSFALDMIVKFIETEVGDSEVEGELFRASSLACKMYTVYSKVVGVQYLWRTLARSIHTLDDAGQAEDRRQHHGSSTTPPSTGQVSMMDLGTLEVDPERLADKLEREVDQAVLTDVSIYQYELLLKTGRIFKKVMDSVNSVPRELRIVAKRVKNLVSQKFTEREMDYKGVCAFFFLRFICPAVMTPQIYGVLEHPPGETSQRYFVLISKTLQNLANGTLPSQKEAYMAKMDEFVIDNRDTLHRFIDTLCGVQEAGSSDTLSDDSNHNARDVRLNVADELYYSSLSFIHSHYMAHSVEIQEGFRANHEEEFGQRVHAAMTAVGGGEASNTKKSGKKPKKSHKATSSNA